MNESLFAAVDAGNINIVAALLEQGADVNARDAERRTPFMRAVLARHVDMMRLLLARGADAALVDAEGITAMSMANHHPLRVKQMYTNDPVYKAIIDYWKTWCEEHAPIPFSQGKRILTVYSETEGHQAFRLKTGEIYEGYLWIDEENEPGTVTFSWAPSPFDWNNGWPEQEDLIIAFSDIDLDSLYW